MALRTKIINNLINKDDLFLREGFNLSPLAGNIVLDGLYNSNTSTNSAAGSLIFQVNVTATRIFYFEKFYISSDKDITVTLEVSDAFNSGKSMFIRKRIFARTTEEFELNCFVHSNGRLLLVQYEGDGSQTMVKGGVVGYDVTEDINYGAKKSILFVGDSIMYGANLGNFQSYLSSDVYTFKLRDYYNAKGIDTRAVVLATHGITTGGLNRELIGGKFDSQKWDMIVYCAGTNNSIEGANPSTIATQLAGVTSDYNSFIDWKKTKQSNAKLLMLGCPPLSSTSRESQLVGMRDALSTIVTNNSNANIFYANLGNAFTPTDLTKYSDNPGVHPNIVGNQSIYTNSILPALNAFIPTL